MVGDVVGEVVADVVGEVVADVVAEVVADVVCEVVADVVGEVVGVGDVVGVTVPGNNTNVNIILNQIPEHFKHINFVIKYK